MTIRDKILNAKDLKEEKVLIQEWGVTIVIRELTAAQRDKYESSIYEIKGKDVKVNQDNIRAKLVTMTTYDEEGNKVFEPGDVEALGLKSAAALDKLFDTAQRLSGLTKAQQEKAEKN